jgi:fibronectin type 3 domain-containing protein
MVALVASLGTACGGEDHDDATTPPAAPSNLQASEVAGGAHLTWSDNSDNEEHFMVMRRLQSGDDFEEVATTTFDAEQYHDESVATGTAYVYQVIAMNGAGEASSAEVSFTAP